MSSNTTMPLTKEEVFSRVPKSEAVTYSSFNRDHRHLTAIDASYMYPIYVDEVYPGDIFEMNGRHLNRLLTPIKPFYDNLYARYLFFYVPNRLVWDNWKTLMGERRRNNDIDSLLQDPQVQVPMLNSGDEGVAVGSIFDYAGVPVGVPNLEFSAIPFRGMNLVYNTWIRDENLSKWLNVGGVGTTEQELADSEFGDSDQLSNYNLFRISKRHDMFTSGLPLQQLGAPQTVSVGTQARVYGDNLIQANPANLSAFSFYNEDGSYAAEDNFNNYISQVNKVGAEQFGYGVYGAINTGGNKFDLTTRLYTSLYADLENVTGFSISDFRTALQLQALKELNMRMGHRYKEIIYGEFDVMVSDATLDRPEFLGSYQIAFNTIPVASTAETSENPQGTLAAFSYTSNSPHHCFTKAFEEHGYVLGFVVCQGDQSYQYGLPKMYSRKNKYDFYTPLLADISEQAVKMKEIYAQGADVVDVNGEPVDEKTFNFQEAWPELRYKPNMITGKMRSGVEGTLDYWHLGTEFAPTIIDDENIGIPFNQDFIEDNTRENLERVLAIKNEPQIESDNYFMLNCTRELPLYSVPAYLTGRL